MINKVVLVGNLGQDPELRSTGNGTSVCSISVATSHRVKDGDEWKDKTEWHKVVVWGHAAEFVSKYGVKGRQVYVEGRLQTRKWQDKDGNDRYSTEVVAEVVKLLGSKGESQAHQGRRDDSRDATSDADDEAIPF